MATIDSSYVEKELRAIRDTSQAVRKLLRQRFEQLEANPGGFPTLERVDPRIRAEFPGVTLRKVKIESGRHSFRLVCAHWEFEEGEEHVDILYAFRRKAGYPIDWDWIDAILREREES